MHVSIIDFNECRENNKLWNKNTIMCARVGPCQEITARTLHTTDDSSIFTMITVVGAEGRVGAHCQGGLWAWAPDIVQPDGPAALAKAGTAGGRQGRATAQLSTHHLGILQIPEVITHRPPLALVEDLHSARAVVGPRSQTHLSIHSWSWCDGD